MLNNRRNKYIKQRNHHSIFLTTQKGRVVIGSFTYVNRIDPLFIFILFIFYFFILQCKVKKRVKVNSIVEPYAMYKRCLYGCSILSFFLLLYYSLSFRLSSCEIKELFIMLYHQGNDPSTC